MHLLLHRGCWTLCYAPRTRCRHVRATYREMSMQRSLWHGGRQEVVTQQLPGGWQFYFNETESFEDLLVHFQDPVQATEALQLETAMWRGHLNEFPADLSMRPSSKVSMNLQSLGTYFYHKIFDALPSQSCWGGGYLPHLCCARRAPAQRRHSSACWRRQHFMPKGAPSVQPGNWARHLTHK